MTTNLSISFLRRPGADGHVTAVASLMKLGRRLAVGEVRLCSEADDEPIAHATITYSIPPGHVPDDAGSSG